MPKPKKVLDFARGAGYPVEITQTHRILGPRKGSSCTPGAKELFVTNLPPNITEEFLIPFFEKCGKIGKFRLHLYSNCAYILYDSGYSSDAALYYLNNVEIKSGYKIGVNEVAESTRLFVGNVPEVVSRDELWKELTRRGMRGILEVIMYRSYVRKGCNRGYVFIEFANAEAAMEAKWMFHGKEVLGRVLKIDFALAMSSNKQTHLVLENLDINLEEMNLKKLLENDILRGNNCVTKVHKFRTTAIVYFMTRRDAQKAFALLKQYFSKGRTQVEVLWKTDVIQKSKGCFTKHGE